MQNQIDSIVENFVADQVRAQVLEQFERERAKKTALGNCPICNNYEHVKKSRVENISQCRGCRTYFGPDYLFIFPTWARGKKQFFRRAFCLRFNIQGTN